MFSPALGMQKEYPRGTSRDMADLVKFAQETAADWKNLQANANVMEVGVAWRTHARSRTLLFCVQCVEWSSSTATLFLTANMWVCGFTAPGAGPRSFDVIGGAEPIVAGDSGVDHEPEQSGCAELYVQHHSLELGLAGSSSRWHRTVSWKRAAAASVH